MDLPAPSSTTASKIRASLYGLAISDALGGPAEFCFRDSFPTISTLLPNPNFSLPPGSWTDDTSLTLCLAHSLLTSPTFSEEHQAQTYISWHRHGFLSVTGACFDIGNATLAALGLWESGKTAKQVKKKMDTERGCGNGSLMRVAPVAALYWREGKEKAEKLARRSSNVTHSHELCQEACALYTTLLCAIFSTNASGQPGITKTELLELIDRYEYQKPTLQSALTPTSKKSTLQSALTPTSKKILSVEREVVRSTGYVLDTLHAALWCFFSTQTFEEGTIKVVNLGDDADTVAAVYGGLAGAWYGVDAAEEGGWWGGEGKAKNWWDGLKGKEMLKEVVEKVIEKDEKGGLTV